MPARLVSLNGRAEIPLNRLLVVVGRLQECEVRLDSSRISRRHCCLALDQGEVLVRDLGSRNGTRINGMDIQEGILKPGDELSIGHLTYRLEFSREPATDVGPGQARPSPTMVDDEPETSLCDILRPHGEE